MASIEEYVELLLPLQQETIARAALRGVRWDRIVGKDSTWVPAQEGSSYKGAYRTFERTKYSASVPLPDGTTVWFGDFDDVYECAVRGLSLLERAEAPPAEPCSPDAPFALAPGNEQPTPERKSFRWPTKRGHLDVTVTVKGSKP